MGLIEDFIESKTREDKVIAFYTQAFDVDGEVKMIKTIKGFTILGVVELNDSKRGKFHIGRLEINEQT